jgi:sugar phosphate isomerase/epimerase
MRYAYNTLVYGDEPIEKGIGRLARFGYDGVEIVGEPATTDAGAVRDRLDRHGIAASSICAIYTPERDLVAADAAIRHAAVDYVRACVDFARRLGAEVVSVTPTACMKIRPEAAIEQELGWAEEGIRAAGEYAGEHGVRLAVEPWNRYETYLVNRVAQSLELVERVGLPSVGCMADTFHMAIEEQDPPAAIRLAGERLYHVHFADSNRAAPGRGHTDFRPLVAALRDIGYAGYVSFELLPAAGDPFLALKGGKAQEFFDQYTEEAISFVRGIERELDEAERAGLEAEPVAAAL